MLTRINRLQAILWQLTNNTKRRLLVGAKGTDNAKRQPSSPKRAEGALSIAVCPARSRYFLFLSWQPPQKNIFWKAPSVCQFTAFRLQIGASATRQCELRELVLHYRNNGGTLARFAPVTILGSARQPRRVPTG